MVWPTGRDAYPHRHEHGQDTTGREQKQPARLGVTTRPEAVHYGDRKARIGKPVRDPPRAISEPTSEYARDHDRDQHVRGDRAEPEPHGPVGRHERDDRVDQPDWRERIEHGGHDVHRQERQRQQRGAAMHRVEHEPRNGVGLHPPDIRDPEREADREQHQRDGSGPARQIPQRARSGRIPHLRTPRRPPEPALPERAPVPAPAPATLTPRRTAALPRMTRPATRRSSSTMPGRRWRRARGMRARPAARTLRRPRRRRRSASD